MLSRPPENFTKHLIDFSIDKISIEELEALYTPAGLIDNCLAAVEFLVTDWYDAALMLKDLVNSYQLKDHIVDYRSLVAQSMLLEMSSKWLFNEPQSRRKAVIYVMGKLFDKQYLPILNKVFEKSKNTDPFIMDTLMPELSWLEDEQYNEKFNYLASHENFVFRLTCIEMIQQGAEQGVKTSIEQLEKFSNDTHPAVSDAAKKDFYSFNFASADCKTELYNPTSAEYKDQIITLEQFTDWIMNKYR